MKRVSLLLIIVAVLVMVAMTLSVFAAKQDATGPKGKEVTMTGRLGCTFCTLSHPTKPCGKGCCVHCIKAGDAPMLVDKTGNMYLLTTNEKQVAMMNAERMKMVGGQVTVKGLLVKGKGIQAIFVDSMAKAK